MDSSRNIWHFVFDPFRGSTILFLIWKNNFSKMKKKCERDIWHTQRSGFYVTCRKATLWYTGSQKRRFSAFLTLQGNSYPKPFWFEISIWYKKRTYQKKNEINRKSAWRIVSPWEDDLDPQKEHFFKYSCRAKKFYMYIVHVLSAYDFGHDFGVFGPLFRGFWNTVREIQK